MLFTQTNLAVTISYYLIGYAFLTIAICFVLMIVHADITDSWNIYASQNTGVRLLLFSCLLALTGLPPMFMLAPKLHLLCFFFTKSNTLITTLALVLIFLSWFVYYSALRSLSQTSINSNITIRQSRNLNTNYCLILACFLALILLAPFLVDDLILWVYFFTGL